MSQPPKTMKREPDRPLKAGDKDEQRIAKLLARAGVASRREIERMIEARRIAIDGIPIETPATLVTSLHKVTVDGKPVSAPAPARLFRFHKPPGLLTAERDPRGRPTIYDSLPEDMPRVIPVGRLDLGTEGLLLLTTDGGLKRQLELPSTGIPRTYRARAFGNISQDQLEDLIDGIEIEGVRYGSIDANLERRTGANVWIEMKLTEGKNREVRRVLEFLGLQVSRLIRTAYGPFPLGDLPVGAVDEVRQNDLVQFRKLLKLPDETMGEAMANEPMPGASQPLGAKPIAPKSVFAKAGEPKPARAKIATPRLDAPKPEGRPAVEPRVGGPKPAGAKPRRPRAGDARPSRPPVSDPKRGLGRQTADREPIVADRDASRPRGRVARGPKPGDLVDRPNAGGAKRGAARSFDERGPASGRGSPRPDGPRGPKPGAPRSGPPKPGAPRPGSPRPTRTGAARPPRRGGGA